MCEKIYLRGPRPRKASFYSCPIFLLLFSVCCFTGADSFAQTTAFEPIKDDTRQLALLVNHHEGRFKSNLNTLPAENKKDLNETFTKRWTSIRARFEEGEIYTAPSAQQYLDAIVHRIKTANPTLKDSEFSCYFSRSGVPNASSLGEGVILVNMGLLSRLQNESQLAFVLCHEIAHSYFAHGDKAIREYVAKLNSKEFQQDLRTIKKQSYGKRESLEELTKAFSFDTRRHTRQNETAADSMAIMLLKNTDFDINQAITTLQLLDTIDDETVDVETSLTRLFDHPSYPFQKRWLKKESGLLGGHAQLQQHEWADSLKTHPDCSKRISVLTPRIEELKQAGKVNTAVNPQFNLLKETARYESIEFDYRRANYSSCLFAIIQLMKKNPSDPYLITMTGKCLNKIYTAFKAHELSRVTDLPSPDQSADYNLLCQFIQRLYAENVASISYYFLLKNEQVSAQYKAFAPVFAEASMIK